MKLTNTIINQIESCTTPKQVMNVLTKNHIEITKNTTDEVGTFSVWIDDTTRIYKPLHRKMKVQTWQKVKLQASGIPTFFGSDMLFY